MMYVPGWYLKLYGYSTSRVCVQVKPQAGTGVASYYVCILASSYSGFVFLMYLYVTYYELLYNIIMYFAYSTSSYYSSVFSSFGMHNSLCFSAFITFSDCC